MKTKTLVLTALLSLGMVFQGCEKEENNTQLKNERIQKNKANNAINKTPAPEPEYIIIDTLDFALETEEDFENMFDLIIENENQFIRTNYGTSGEIYNIVMEAINGTPLPSEGNEMEYSCTFTGQSHSSSTSWAICLRGFIDVYNYNKSLGICMDHNGRSAVNGEIWIIEIPC